MFLKETHQTNFTVKPVLINIELTVQSRKRTLFMENPITLTEKYERNGWPSLKRTDLKPPAGLTLPLLTSIERVRTHMLSSQGQIACIKDSETSSDVFTMPASGGWLARISTDRALAPSWDDEIPQWSPDGKWLAFGLADMFTSCRRMAACPKKSPTSPPQQAVRAGCQTRTD
jgi:dipeptidyl aminopeptidase/acylaminoacyl peptidase